MDVTRTHGIGAKFIKISYSCKKEIEGSLVISKDWYGNAMLVHPYSNAEEWITKSDERAEGTFIIPSAESKGALEDFEDIFSYALQGIKIFDIALTDASKVIT